MAQFELSDIAGDLALKLGDDVLRAVDRVCSLLDDKEDRRNMLLLVAMTLTGSVAAVEQNEKLSPPKFRSPMHSTPTTREDYVMAVCSDIQAMALAQVRRSPRG